MAMQPVIDAVKARLAAFFTRCPVRMPNGDLTPPKDKSAYLLVQFPVANSERSTLQRTFTEEGGIRLVLHVPAGEGPDLAVLWCDELATLFRSQNFAGVEALVPSSATFHDDNDAGAYARVSIVVPYRYRFRG